MVTFEFSLNDFPWIQRIQWIMTKSKSSMVTRGITHLATDTLPVLVIQSVFSLLPLGRYPLPITTPSRYQPIACSGKLLYTTILRNVTFVRCRMSLVTILLLDLVMIHWIRWIQRKSFREYPSKPFHRSRTIQTQHNTVFPKWNGNSGNLINHWSMNWDQFKDPVSHLCLAGAVIAFWSPTQEAAASNPFNE